jgi:hypothetical protein
MSSSDANAVAVKALAGVKEAASQPNNLSEAAVSQSQSAIVHEVAKAIDPMLTNMQNREPWYQSRVILGSVFAVLASLAGIFGWAFPAELQGKTIEAVITLGPFIATLVGALYAWYGRTIARTSKPVGS